MAAPMHHQRLAVSSLPPDGSWVGDVAPVSTARASVGRLVRFRRKLRNPPSSPMISITMICRPKNDKGDIEVFLPGSFSKPGRALYRTFSHVTVAPAWPSVIRTFRKPRTWFPGGWNLPARGGATQVFLPAVTEV